MKILSILALVLLIACKREEDVAKYAAMEEWESYKITGFCWLGCSEDDFYRTSFTAIKKDHTIRGCTCSGFLFKNTTLRLD